MINRNVYEKRFNFIYEKNKGMITDELIKWIEKKVYLASSYDNHWLVIVNDLQVARVKNFNDIKTSDMRHEQLTEWDNLNAVELNALRLMFDRKNKALK